MNRKPPSKSKKGVAGSCFRFRQSVRKQISIMMMTVVIVSRLTQSLKVSFSTFLAVFFLSRQTGSRALKVEVLIGHWSRHVLSRKTIQAITDKTSRESKTIFEESCGSQSPTCG